MKYLHISIIVFLLTAVASTYTESFDSMEHLPEESLIKQECSKCGYGNWLYSNKRQKGCAYIRDVLAKFNEPDPEPGLSQLVFGLIIGPNGRDLMGDLQREVNCSKMKQNVFAVLGDKYSQEEMRAEHNLLSDTAKEIRKTRTERKEKANKLEKEAREKRFPKDPY